LPILIGLAAFCMGNFGSIWRFSTPSLAIANLIATGMGDEIQNTYHAIYGVNALISSVVLYCWIFFSNNCII
jgi:hypothetical protein